jgi:hypothetical protein
VSREEEESLTKIAPIEHEDGGQCAGLGLRMVSGFEMTNVRNPPKADLKPIEHE